MRELISNNNEQLKNNSVNAKKNANAPVVWLICRNM